MDTNWINCSDCKEIEGSIVRCSTHRPTFTPIPSIYFEEKVGHLAACIERLPKVSDQGWELQAIEMYAKAIVAEAAKWQRVTAREEKAYNEGVAR